MEERYEIRGTLGQGGIGSVYRAYDHKLNREVAIKRILSEEDDAKHTEEATRQLIAEAEALAALQHPHIVTILDVGSDEQGPYVVMELLNGKTLDDILENAPLTWEDFAEVAKQSLEALIAAQELDMIHSDLKPANIMLTWLPSGKFQVKILDFGLAVLIRSQSQEEISKLESVYGSILFMPPEQFERQVLDERSDLYSLGCCFYQALAGAYPFNGETGREVMEAHLNHSVIPLEQIRADVPIWVCQWVMWLINRGRNDRPATARDALGNFIQNERQVNPEMSLGSAYARRPKLVIPATGMAPPPDVAGSPEAADTHDVAASHTSPTGKRKSNALMKIAIAAAAVILLGGLGWLIQFRNQKVRANDAYYAMMSMAADEKNETVPVSGEQLRQTLDVIANLDPNNNLALVCRALIKAKANDESSVDAAIATFATRPEISNNLRMKLLEEVLPTRRHADATPILLQFAAQTTDKQQALSAMKAADHMIEDQHADALLAILTGTSDREIRETAEQMMRDLIFYSSNRKSVAELLEQGRQATAQAEASEAIGRLLQKCKPSKP